MELIMAWTAEAWPQSKGSNAELCFSMAQSPPGNAADFHAGCDGNTHTITVVKTENGNIFGGVSDVDWAGEQDASAESQKAFLYCIRCAGSPTDADGNPVPETMKLREGNEIYAIYKQQIKGPQFGGGPDLSIADKPGDTAASYSAVGMIYKCPEKIINSWKQPAYSSSDPDECGEYLDGLFPAYFKVADYEVYTFSLDSSLPPVR